jgi:ferredoxin-NADP reductase
MKAQITSKKFFSPDILHLELSLPEAINFKAGQFFPLTLLTPPITDNRGDRRMFGFVNSPVRNKNASLITHIGPSSFKKYLTAAPLGTEVDVGSPEGEMTLPDDTSKPLVFITADVGIAPYISILHYIRDQSLPYQITLINLPPVILANDLHTFTLTNPWFTLLTPDSFDTILLRDQFPEPGKLLFYITGIPHFVTNIVHILHDWGLPPTQMKLEVFTGY